MCEALAKAKGRVPQTGSKQDVASGVAIRVLRLHHKGGGIEPMVDVRRWTTSVPLPMRFGRSAPPALVMPPDSGNSERNTGTQARRVSAELPAPRMAFIAPPRFSNALPFPNGKLIGRAEGPLPADVVVRVAAVQLRGSRVHGGYPPCVADLRHVVDGVRPGERGEKAETRC